MLTNKGFEIVIASLPDYDYVVAEIYFDGLFFALISQESEGEFILETPGPELEQTAITRKVRWLDFQLTVANACKRLNEHLN